MLRLRHEDKAAQPPGLTEEERERLTAAKAHLRVKQDAHRAALRKAPRDRRGDPQTTRETIATSREVTLAQMHLERLRDEIKNEFEARQVPPELWS